MAAAALTGPLSCVMPANRRPASPQAQATAAMVPADQTAADVLVASMRRSLAMAGDRSWGEVLISLDKLNNYSHAGRPEFDRMRSALAQQLTRAGRAGRIPLRFVSDAGEDLDYELTGTVYLVTAAGRDEWELFMSMRPPGETWTIWRADSAVRMTRGEGDRVVLRLEK